MRAYATAIQPPAGPVFLSPPLDDWAAPALGPGVVRNASIRPGPDPARLRRLAGAIAGAERPVLIFGAAVARASGWDQAVALGSEQRMRRFVADASHELRTPLTSVRGLAEYGLQQGDAASRDELLRLMSMIAREADRMGALASTTITAAQVIVQPPATSASNPGGQVIGYSQGEKGSSEQANQIPADYTQGSGTLVSGTAADKATEAALAAYPGGVVDRMVALGNGQYEVHYIGVNWPHHIFVNQDFQVIGADD